jgi:hypothetical protein
MPIHHVQKAPPRRAAFGIGRAAGSQPEISFRSPELLFFKVFSLLPGYFAFPPTLAAAGPIAKPAGAKERVYYRAWKEPRTPWSAPCARIEAGMLPEQGIVLS